MKRKVELIEEVKWDGTVFHKIYVNDSILDLFIIHDEQDKQKALECYEAAASVKVVEPTKTTLKSTEK